MQDWNNGAISTMDLLSVIVYFGIQDKKWKVID